MKVVIDLFFLKLEFPERSTKSRTFNHELLQSLGKFSPVSNFVMTSFT